MNIIIGGSGFIGTVLARDLAQRGSDFILVDKHIGNSFPSKTTVADVTNAEELKKAIVGTNATCINLAAEHRDDVLPKNLYYDVNVGGAKNLCDALEFAGINRLIFTSSVAVYGFSKYITTEHSDINPFNDYGKSKFLAENIYKDWQKRDPTNRCLVIIRPTVVFGEGNKGNVHNLIKQISSGRFLMIGNGSNKKSLAYVKNVSQFIKFSMDNIKPGVYTYNYVDEPTICMNELVALIRHTLGIRPIVRFKLPLFIGIIIGFSFDFFKKYFHIKGNVSLIRIRKFSSDSIYSSSSLIKTGFTPNYSLKEGLIETISKYKN